MDGERLKPTTREINFYGPEVPGLLKDNYKLVTVRRDNPKYHGFAVREVVTAKCEGEDIPLVIWGVKEGIPLKKIDPLLLALDGFMSVKQAVKELKVYPGYEEIGPNSPMVVIATMTLDNYNSLYIEQKQRLLPWDYSRLTASVLRDVFLKRMVLKAVAFWAEKRGIDAARWIQKNY